MTVKSNLSEAGKLCKLQIEKPYVWQKMLLFNDKIFRGESIAIVRIEYDYCCNFRCSHCCISDLQKVTRRKLTPEDVADISLQADELGLARFVITGGEPLVFHDLDEVVAAIDPSRHYISMDTNGWLLTRDKAKHLKTIGVDRIQLSIDSFSPEEHDAFRNAPNSHRMALRGADHALDVGLDLFIQTVVTKSRLYSAEFKRFIEFWNGKGVGVFVTYAKPVGEWKGKKDDLIGLDDIRWFEVNYEPNYNAFTHMTIAYGRDMGCIAMKGMISITAFGDVNPCLYWHKPVGNVFTESLKDILERGMRTPPFDKYIDGCPAAEGKF